MNPSENNCNDQATEWFVQLSSGTARPEDYQAWQAWCQADPANEHAWKKVEQLTSQFKHFSSQVAVTATLRRLYAKPDASEQAYAGEKPDSSSKKSSKKRPQHKSNISSEQQADSQRSQEPPFASRRRILKQLAVLMAVSSSSYFAYKQQPWQNLTADYTTGTGERREVALADGTRLHMNTGTAINVEFDSTYRTITLLKGEVLIETGHEKTAIYRPFRVNTAHGTATALGTHFSVIDKQAFSSLSVFDGAVRINLKRNEAATITLQAGESVNFSTTAITDKSTADFAATSWTQGFIIIDKLSMADFLQELSRYRTGLLQCDPRIAHLQLSGAFPTDSDAALNILTQKFPVKIESRTRYWTRVVPI